MQLTWETSLFLIQADNTRAKQYAVMPVLQIYAHRLPCRLTSRLLCTHIAWIQKNLASAAN